MMTAYAATASIPKDRSRAVAIITGAFSVGMVVGPGNPRHQIRSHCLALQLLFIPLGHPGIRVYKDFTISVYTLPGITCCFVNVFAIFLLSFVFEEKYAGLANDCSAKEKKVYVPPYDKCAVTVCHVTRFTQFFTFSNLET
jgi:MFS family permease